MSINKFHKPLKISKHLYLKLEKENKNYLLEDIFKRADMGLKETILVPFIEAQKRSKNG